MYRKPIGKAVSAASKYKAPKRTIPFIATKTASVFVPDALDPNLVDYSAYHAKQKELFSLNSKYISPSEFGYSLPSGNVPEFAFVGRSNVGKSSLIRALLNNNIVRVSSTPGCTQSVNYYSLYRAVNSAQIYLVDLPGYGFASTSKANKENWRTMIKGFLDSRPFSILRRVYVLIDSRHGVKESDVEMFEMLNRAELVYQIILTKYDETTPESLKAALQSTFNHIIDPRGISPCLPYVHTVSSHSGFGMNDLKCSIAEVVSQKWADANAKMSREEIDKLIQEQKELQRSSTKSEIENEPANSRPWNWKVDVSNGDSKGEHPDTRVFPGAGVLSPSVDPLDFIKR